MTSRTGILVVDDHQGFVDAVSLSVAEEHDLWLAGTATSASEALDWVTDLSCDVVLLAQALETGGIQLADEMLRRRRDLPIVMLTDAQESDDLIEAVQLGVRGWVSRGDGPEALLTAVRAVARGESHLPTDQLRTELTSRSDPPPWVEEIRHLTERETAVLQSLAAGLSRTEISDLLQLSPNTVRTHVRSILRKCHVHSAPAAVALMTVKEPDHG